MKSHAIKKTTALTETEHERSDRKVTFKCKTPDSLVHGIVWSLPAINIRSYSSLRDFANNSGRSRL